MIPVSIHYKEYPNAPKATRKSILLGMLTCWFFLLFGCGIVHYVIGVRILNEGIGLSETLSFILTLPVDVIFLRKISELKERLNAKLDQEALLEAALH